MLNFLDRLHLWRLGLTVIRIAAVCVVAFVLSPPAHADESAAGDASHNASEEGKTPPAYEAAVIGPGHEELIAKMLGKGATLPGSCVIDEGQIEGALVKATYKCPGGDVTLQLTHPSKGAAQAKVTKHFAISLLSGTPPPGLVDAVEASVRSGEAQFEWTVPPPPPHPVQSAAPMGNVVPIALLCVASVAVLAWLVLRRRAT